jgi:hypothetical protein
MKKFINKYFVGACALGLSMAATSCSDDYLDTKPTSSVSTSEAVGTTENAAKAINGIAEIMKTQQGYFGQGFCGENNIISQYENYCSQDYLYNGLASGWSVIMNQDWHDRTSSIYLSYAWYYYYTIIGGANSIIANIDAATGTDAEKAFIKAQALTYRAYGYEKLLHYYAVRWKDSNNGSADGVVLRLDESTGDIPMSSQLDVYNQIYTDCKDAIALFEQSGMDREAGKVWFTNKNVAHAVYARAALNREDYATALAQAKLAREGYPLMTNAEYASGFCNPTSEWIMGSYGGADENMWYWTYGTMFACNGYYTTKYTYGAGAISRELAAKIPNEDFRKSLFLTEDKFPGYDMNEAANQDQSFGFIGLSANGKLTSQVAYDAWDYIEKNSVSGLSEAYSTRYVPLGSHLKFWVYDMPGISHLPFIRSSEMVLIEAEANYFLGNESAAIASLVELNATSGRNPNYTCDKSGNDLFEEIVAYRGFELWGEGFQWSDFKRWKRASVRTAISKGGSAHTAIAVTINPEDKLNWTWQIPLNESDFNKGLSYGPEVEE